MQPHDEITSSPGQGARLPTAHPPPSANVSNDLGQHVVNPSPRPPPLPPPSMYANNNAAAAAGVAGQVGAAQIDEYDAYGNLLGPGASQAAAAAAAASSQAERNNKREKRRRDMVERVSRLHEDTVARRDRVFHDLSEIFSRTADELLPPPVFPTFDLSIPVGQLPPSLPFTDPVIPDMHPTPYLFSLHRMSLERANQLLATRLFHLHQTQVARKLYDAEVERIEDEYEAASKSVVDRLLEGVEERRRRLTEEKDGEGTTLESFLDPQSRSHGTRRMRNGPSRMRNSTHHHGDGTADSHGGAMNGNGANTHGSGSPAPESANGGNNAVGGGGGVYANGTLASLLAQLSGSVNVSDPFNIAGTFLPSSTSHSTSSAHPLLSALAAPGGSLVAAAIASGGSGAAGGSGSASGGGSGTAAASAAGGGANGLGSSTAAAAAAAASFFTTKRKTGGRQQPGLPPQHYAVQSGTYAQFGKSVAGLSSLRGDEVEGDLGEVRRKRMRLGGRGRRNLNKDTAAMMME